MTSPNVVEDGLDVLPKRTSEPRWGWLAAGLLVGIGVSVMALRVDREEPVPVSTTTAVATDSMGGLGEVVEGFPDGLITTIRADGRSLETLLWPVAGEPYDRTIPVGASNPPTPVTFDASGRRMATVLPLPESAGGVLYAGVPENAAIVEVGVTGHAWHDSEARALAYTTIVDGELLLWVLRDGLSEPEVAARTVGIEGGLSTWGDWGFAVEDDGHDTIVRLTTGGEIEGTTPGRVLGSHETGWLVIDDDGLRLLTPGGEVRALTSLDPTERLLTGAFSPDRRLLAVATSNGLTVISLADDEVIARSEERPGVAAAIEWSSDNRFVVYPAVRGLDVIDTSDGAEHRLLTSHTFTGVGALRLTDS